jgi:hypothetical protein
MPRSQFSSLGINLVAEYVSAESEDKHVVLDLSYARQSVVNFMSELDCIYIVTNAINSLTNNVECRLRDEDHPNPDYSKIFRSIFAREPPHSISAILVWDLFNYLPRTDIIGLMSFLSPCCRRGARLFAISWLTETVPGSPGIFELTQNKEIIYEATSQDFISSPEYLAQSLVDMMPSFIPNRLSVTRSGMLEVILEFDELATPPDPEIIPSRRLSYARNS